MMPGHRDVAGVRVGAVRTGDLDCVQGKRELNTQALRLMH